MSKQPITRISLPTHHPAVAACGDGGTVTLRAKRVPTEDPVTIGMADGGKVKGPQPPPTSTDFHVMAIEPGEDPKEEAGETAAQERAESKGKPKPKKVGPMEYLKGRK